MVGGAAVVVAVTWAVLLHWYPADPAARVRRLFARSNPHRYANQAALVIRETSRHDPGFRARVFTRLLHDHDARVRRGALMLLADHFAVATDAPHGEEDGEEITVVLAEWFDGASLEERLAHLPYSFVCWLRAHGVAPVDDPGVVGQWALDLEALPPDELRWLLAVTLERAEPARTFIEFLLLQAPPADEAARRLRLLDGLDRAATVRTALERRELQPLDVAELLAALPPALDLLDRLGDPNPAVRQAAGRLLAVCGDARGLPGLHEWLRAHLRFSGPVNTLMTALFGDDWRTRDASGGPARDPGARGR